MKNTKRFFSRAYLSVGLFMMVAVVAFAASLHRPSSPGIPEPYDITPYDCMVRYDRPVDNGGTPIRSYLIEKLDISTKNWVSAGVSSNLSHHVRDLTENKKYQFRVTASNKVGSSDPSEPSDPITARDRI